MRRASHPAGALAALALTVALAAASTACSGDSEPGAAPDPDISPTTEAPPRLDIDPRRFYEDYEPSGDAVTTTAAPAPGAPGADRTAGPDQMTADSDASAGAGGGGGPEGGVAEPPLPPEPEDPGFLDDNTFTDPGANPFVATVDDPQSTFGLDVDTGSYGVGRTFLAEGYRPEPESVRTEEWVNAFGYGYAPPEDGDLAVHVDGAPAPFAEDGTRLVRVGVQSRGVELADRPEAALTLVVDTSGSMDIRERLGLVRSTLALLALELRDSDTVAVVTYDDEANLVLPPTPAVEAETIVAAIGQLQPSGSTNMEAGLREGYAQARAAFRPDAINTVILASDGVANQGVTGADPLSELVRNEGEDGIALVTVGYGMGNYNDELMEQLADRGDGFYSYVDTYEEAERLFTTELTSTLTVVAEETRAQVTFDPDAVSSYRLLGYENRALADESFRDDAVDTGELGAGHAVTALYEVQLAEGGPDELGEVALRHRPAGRDDFEEQAAAITTGDLADDLDDAAPSLRLAAAVAAFAEVLGEHPVALTRGTTLDDVAALAADVGDEDGDGDEPAAGRPGAAELTRLVDAARAAAAPIDPQPEPSPGPVPLPRPVP
jgi:Ca-activated chloride channel family protein